MKKYNIVFLFILLLFLGLSKNVNISTKDNDLNSINNVSSNANTSDDANIPWIPDSAITIDKLTGNISNINLSSLTDEQKKYVYIPSTVVKDGIAITVKSIGTGVDGLSIFGSGWISNNDSFNTTVAYIYLPSTLTSIGSHALRNLSSLYEIYVPASVTNIGGYAFIKNKTLKCVYILGNISELNSGTFQQLSSAEGGNKLTDVYFLGNSKIKSWGGWEIALNVSSLTFHFANQECYQSAKDTIPSSLNSNIILSNSYEVQYYEDEEIVFNSSTKTIMKYVGSSSNIIVPSLIGGYNVTTLASTSYSNNFFIKSVTIEEGISVLNDSVLDDNELSGVFRNLKNASNINLPSTLTYIGDKAFYITNCTFNNSNILKLDSIQKIGSSVFSGDKINEIYLGDKLQTVGSAFTYLTNLDKVYIFSSNVTKYADNVAKKIIFSSKSLYVQMVANVFLTNKDKCTYEVKVQYQNTGLFNNPSFTKDFQDKLNNHLDENSTSIVTTYIYYAGDSLDIPTGISDFNANNIGYLSMYKTYANGKYSDQITSSDAATILNKGVIGDSLVIYCNLYSNPTDSVALSKYTVSSFDNNNIPISNTFTFDDLNNNNDNKLINLRFTNDPVLGTTGLPIEGYTYSYSWYKQEDNSSTFALISNNNDKEPNTLTLKAIFGADLDTTYRCTIIISTSNGVVATISKDIILTFEKQDIVIDINNQTVSNNSAISSVYGTDYTASINGVVLSEEDMDLYFSPNYGLVIKAFGNQTVISFIGTLKDASTYQINTLQTGILTTKTNSTNLILISVTSGLFVVEVIVFMVVIFKQRSRG